MSTPPSPPPDPLASVVEQHDRGLALAQDLLAFVATITADARQLAGTIATLTARVQALEAENAALRELAQTDSLTGLANRRGLQEALQREEARARRHHADVALVLLDVDGLKAINDQHGHAAGDALLRTLASALTTVARGSDVAARLGGDEFAILLPEADDGGAVQYVDRLRAYIRAAQLPDGATVAVRFSVGIGSRLQDGSLEHALARADERLVTAKAHAHDATRLARGREARREGRYEAPAL